MGCDIHIFIEYKVGNGPWVADKGHQLQKEDDYEYVNDVDASRRNYYLFGLLAGVRGYGPKARDLPKGISKMAKLASDLYGEDGHSHSYCSFKTFKKACKDAEAYLPLINYEPIAFTNDYDKSYGNLISYIEKELVNKKLELETDNMLSSKKINTTVRSRLVFFFDN